MWRDLHDPELVGSFRREVHGATALEHLLEALAARQELVGISAVTSLGKLRFTRAPTWSAKGRWSEVPVLQTGARFLVAFVPAGASHACAARECLLSELLEVVDLYLLRLVLESGPDAEVHDR